MRTTILAACAIGLTLSGCGESSEKQKAEWMTFCTANDFTPKQCVVLYALKTSNEEASSEAMTASAVANINAGLAIGLSAGNR